MDHTPADNRRDDSLPAGGMSPREWVLLGCIAIFFFSFGIEIIVTRKASAGPEFLGGPVTLAPGSAWAMGLAMIFGGVILPLGYVARRRKGLTSKGSKDAADDAALAPRDTRWTATENPVAEARHEKQAAVRKEGVRLVLIGVGVMVVGLVWAMIAVIESHNMTFILLGVLIGVVGNVFFFWPGLRRVVTGRRRFDDVG